MSTHTAIQPRIVPPSTVELVDTCARRKSRALKQVTVGNDPRIDVAPTAESIVPFVPDWAPPDETSSGSRLGRSGTFAIVLLGHVLAFYVLANLPPQMKEAVAAPLQVTLLSDLPSESEALPPPPPRLQQFTFPTETLLVDIEVADSNAISVTPQQQESTPALSADAGAPKVVSAVEYVREPATKYPPSARALKQRGTVTLRALIDTNGQAREVNVHRSSGHRLLDDAARTAVLNALFKPYKENGRALPVYVFIPIEFGAAHS